MEPGVQRRVLARPGWPWGSSGGVLTRRWGTQEPRRPPKLAEAGRAFLPGICILFLGLVFL